MEIRRGDRVRRRLANGTVTERVGTVVAIYDPFPDGRQDALVRWPSAHKRLSRTDYRNRPEPLAMLVRADPPPPDEAVLLEEAADIVADAAAFLRELAERRTTPRSVGRRVDDAIVALESAGETLYR